MSERERLSPKTVAPEPAKPVPPVATRTSWAPVVQAKLRVGAADDPYEREADAVAARIVRSLRVATTESDQPDGGAGGRVQRSTYQTAPSAPANTSRINPIQRASHPVAPHDAAMTSPFGRIQRAPIVGADGGDVDTDTERMISSAAGGKPLPTDSRSKMETAFGADFSTIRVHEGPRAAAPTKPVIQPKLIVGAANDPYEREADRVADEVITSMRGLVTSAPTRIRRMASSVGAAGGAVDSDTESAIASARSVGRPLDGKLRRAMGSAMGADFSRIRLHVNAQSDELNRRVESRAFTTGSDVFVRRQDYSPGTADGQRLLAHELAHTVQQGAAPSIDSSTGDAGQTTTAPVQRKALVTVIQRTKRKGRGKGNSKGNTARGGNNGPKQQPEEQADTAPAEVAVPAGPTPEELLEQKEQAQLADPAWQKAVQDINRPSPEAMPWSGEADEDGARALPAKMKRRRGRQLEGALSALGSKQEAAAAQFKQEAEEQADREAKDAAEARLSPVRQDANAALKEADKQGLTMPWLKELITTANRHAKEMRWALVESTLDSIESEATKLATYTTSLSDEWARIETLKQPVTAPKRVNELKGLYQDFKRAASRPGNETETVRLLTELRDGLDKETEKGKSSEQEIAAKQKLKDDGLWPGNNKKAATIVEKTRSTVGADAEERAAVVDALDVLATGKTAAGNARDWGGKWGEVHSNLEGNLPGIPGVQSYLEYYVRRGPQHSGPGPRRLVKHKTTGNVYYSHNHYGQPKGTVLPAFVKVTDA